MEKKVLNIRIDATGEAGAYLHKAVQRVLIDKGFEWGGMGKRDIHDFGANNIQAHIESDGERVLWQFTSSDLKATNTKVSAILSGTFNLDKWISDNSSKKKEKPVVYCVDLTWVKGEAREVISKAIQQKAFEKGYKWGGHGVTPEYTDRAGIYFWTQDKTICYSSEFECDKANLQHTEIEISVNKALRGEYKSVK